jgi:hypothetical protein
MMNWKPAFLFRGDDKPGLNAQVFATQEEALASAATRFSRWTMPIGFFVVETTDPVNYRWDDKLGDVMLEQEVVS